LPEEKQHQADYDTEDPRWHDQEENHPRIAPFW